VSEVNYEPIAERRVQTRNRARPRKTHFRFPRSRRIGSPSLTPAGVAAHRPRVGAQKQRQPQSFDEHVVELALAAECAAHDRDTFVVGRIVLNCAAASRCWAISRLLRGAMQRRGQAPAAVEPKVPVDMTLDHTLSVDYHATPDALQRNMQLEIERNFERFSFVKWAMQAYRGIRLIPPDSASCIRSTSSFRTRAARQRRRFLPRHAR
jgi:hypothetical protein